MGVAMFRPLPDAATDPIVPPVPPGLLVANQHLAEYIKMLQSALRRANDKLKDLKSD